MSTNAMIQSPSATQTHLDLFTNYITAGLRESLARVEAAEYVVPDADREQAWQLLSFALNVSAVWPEARELLLALAPKMELAGFREGWIPYLEKGLTVCQLSDKEAAAEILFQIGSLHILQRKYEDAQESLWQSKEYFNNISDGVGETKVFNQLAYLAYIQHRDTDAQRFVKMALFHHENHEQGMTYRIQGLLAIKSNQWQDAEQYHRQALSYFQKEGVERKVAWGLHNLAYALRGQQKYQEAIELFQEALNILCNLKDCYYSAAVQMNLGIVVDLIGQHELAIKHYLDAEQMFRQVNDSLLLAKNYTNLGLSHLSLQQYDHAERFFTQSIELFSTLDNLPERLNAIDGLAIVYLAQHKFQLALDILEPAWAELQLIQDIPEYELRQSLNQHLKEAQLGLSL